MGLIRPSEDLTRYVTAPELNGALAAGGTELRESFAGVPDGPAPGITPTGQPVTNFQFYAGAAPYVRSGFLSTATPSSAQAGSYRIAELKGPVLRVGARFAFSPFTAAGGVMCLSIQASSIASKVEGQVPVSPMHLTITPNGWTVDVNDTDNTGVETVASGVFVSALVANSATLHTVEVILDRDRQQCHLTLPDGSVRTYTDARFALPGNFVYVEPFKTAGSLSSKTDALVRDWWADSLGVDVLPAARRRIATAIVAAPLISPWVPSGGLHQAPYYYRDGMDTVIEGSVSGGSAFSTIFVLPPAFAPAASINRAITANNAFANLEIRVDGSVFLVSGSPTLVSLGCRFPAKPL